MDIDTDPADAIQLSFGFEQGGLTLPDRDYYLLDRFATQRALFRPYVERTLARTGNTGAAAHADTIVAFEMSIAEASYSRADAGRRSQEHQPDHLGGAGVSRPALPWARFVAAAGLPALPTQRVIVGQKDAIVAIARLWATTPLETLKAWATFRTADGARRSTPTMAGRS